MQFGCALLRGCRVLGNRRIALPDDARGCENSAEFFHLGRREVVNVLDLVEQLGVAFRECRLRHGPRIPECEKQQE
jgi:hypothetical protein